MDGMRRRRCGTGQRGKQQSVGLAFALFQRGQSEIVHTLLQAVPGCFHICSCTEYRIDWTERPTAAAGETPVARVHRGSVLKTVPTEGTYFKSTLIITSPRWRQLPRLNFNSIYSRQRQDFT